MSFLASPFRIAGSVAQRTAEAFTDPMGIHDARRGRHHALPGPLRIVEEVARDTVTIAAGALMGDGRPCQPSRDLERHRQHEAQVRAQILQEEEESKDYIREKLAFGSACLNQNNGAGALAQFGCVLIRDSENLEAMEGMKAAYKLMGQAAMDLGSYHEAVKAFAQAEAVKEMELVLGKWFQEIGECEERADGYFAQNFSSQVLEAIGLYREVKKALAAIEEICPEATIMGGSGDAVSVKTMHLKIKDKIVVSESWIKKLEAQEIIAKTNAELEPLLAKLDLFGTAGEDAVFPTKDVAEHYLKVLLPFDAQYAAALRIDPACPPIQKQIDLARIRQNIHSKLRAFQTKEEKDAIAKEEGKLKSYSLKKETDLPLIDAACSSWVWSFKRLPPAEAPHYMAMKKIIEAIQERVQMSQRLLKDLKAGSFFIDVAKEMIREAHEGADFPEKYHPRLVEKCQPFLARASLCNRWISLTENGQIVMREIVKRHVKPLLKPGKNCFKPAVKLRSKGEIAQYDVEFEMNHMPAETSLQDIKERFASTVSHDLASEIKESPTPSFESPHADLSLEEMFERVSRGDLL